MPAYPSALPPLLCLLPKLLESLWRHLGASWRPVGFWPRRFPPPVSPSAALVHTADSQCFGLAVQHCPTADTTYTCDLQSPGLTPVRVAVSVTVIQGT